MNLLIIPSWYPSNDYPSTGIFFRQQARILARRRPEWNIGIGLWGSHEPALWLRASKPVTSLFKYASKPPLKRTENILEENCIEFFHPAYTWTRLLAKGNLDGILRAQEKNFERYCTYFGRPDCLLGQVTYPAGFIARRLSEKYKIPYLLIEHMSPFPMPSLKWALKSYLLPTLHKASLVVTVSEALGDQLRSFGVESRHVSNFIDDQFFSPLKKPKRESFTFIAVGRFEAQKNYGLLIEALVHVQTDVSFQVKIIGSGQEEHSLKRKAKGLAVEDHIVWLGELPNEQVRDELQDADAFINTSHHENQPVAILEAIACGLPVLSTRWLGVEEMIHDSNGMLVGDSVSLATAMEQMLTTNRFSNEFIRADFVRRFGTEKQVDLLTSTIEEITALK